MPLFEDAEQEMIEAFQAEAAIDIIYHRGVETLELIGKIWAGRTPFRVTDKDGSRLIWSDRDFLIPVRELVFGGVQVTPDPDTDWIEQVFAIPDGEHPQPTKRFEMMAPDREPKWRYSTQEKMLYRIHTREVVHENE